jgi:hypothetical protein
VHALFPLLAASALALAAPQTPSLKAARAGGPLRIDGRMDEADWAKAEPAEHFFQLYPNYGQAAPLPTQVRILYDDEALYIGARMEHPKALDGGGKAIRTLVHRRDQDSKSDWFGVYIDSLHDRRTAVGFLVNAGGVQRDILCYGDTNQDDSWDAVWESAVTQDEDGWTVEIRIPFSILRINRSAGPQTWGINFQRRDEGVIRFFSQWAVPPRSETAFVSRFPDLVGLEGIEPKPRREFLPYASVQRKFETSAPFDDRRWKVRGGLDAHLSVTSHSQVDATLRPDFGQVEVDQAVLNLSSVETFFPEKRPFFLEGMEIFNVLGPNLLYSRRIGVGLSPYAPINQERVLDSPTVAEINGAAKYTAKYPGGMNVGLLGAQVSSEKADAVDDATGRGFHPEVYPQTSFGVLRVQQQLDEQGSYLGTMHTFMRQASLTGREALVDEVDYLHKSSDRSITFDAMAIHSQAGERDLTPQAGWFGRVHGSKAWQDGFSMEALVASMGKDFTVEDVGFRGRYDEQFLSARVGRQWDQVAGIFRNWGYNLFLEEHHDQRGRVFDREVNLNLNTDTIAFFSLWGGVGTLLPVYDDRELRTYTDPVKKYLRVPRTPTANLGFDTPGNLPWYGRITVGRSWQEGGPSTDWNLFQQIRPTGSLDIQLQSGFTLDEGERKWLGTFDSDPSPVPGQGAGTPVTGLRRLAIYNQVLRVGYAFTPKFTVQMFAQWLAANWVFRDLRSYQNDETLAPGLPAALASLPPPQTAFSFRTHALNLIGRWEFRPGSTLFLVYTHGALDDSTSSTGHLASLRGAISPYHDLTLLQHLPSDDVIQLKMSWLFR